MKKNFWLDLWKSAKEGLKPEWKDLIWIIVCAITSITTVFVLGETRYKDCLAYQPQSLFFNQSNETHPIMDAAGNPLAGDGIYPGSDFEFEFNIEPICTPIACEDGELVCPKSGRGCPGGCGMVCLRGMPSNP